MLSLRECLVGDTLHATHVLYTESMGSTDRWAGGSAHGVHEGLLDELFECLDGFWELTEITAQTHCQTPYAAGRCVVHRRQRFSWVS